MPKIIQETRHKLVGTNGVTMYIEQSEEGFILTSGESTRVCVDIDQETATELANMLLKPVRRITPKMDMTPPRGYKPGDRVIILEEPHKGKNGVVRKVVEDRVVITTWLGGKGFEHAFRLTVPLESISPSISPSHYPRLGDKVLIINEWSHGFNKTGTIKGVTALGTCEVELLWGHGNNTTVRTIDVLVLPPV